MNLKHLIKKFSYNQILEEIKRQPNWKLPSSLDVKNTSIEIDYDHVWVTDPVELEIDKKTHAHVYDVKNDKVYLCNKSFLQNIIVIKTKRKEYIKNFILIIFGVILGIIIGKVI